MSSDKEQEIKNKIEVNNILIRIYKNINCVKDEVSQMQLENIQLTNELNALKKTIQ